MTPLQKLRHAIVLKAHSLGYFTLPDDIHEESITAANVDNAWDYMVESDAHWDARNEIRCSGQDTGLPVPWHGQLSRNYESKAVAARMPDGSWVGWTYWYGGGKHGSPESIDWMDNAYDLDCVEQEVVVIQRTFSLKTVPA